MRVGASQYIIAPVTKLEFVEDHHRVQSVVPATSRNKIIPILPPVTKSRFWSTKTRGSFAPATKRYRIEKDDSQHRSHQAHTADPTAHYWIYLRTWIILSL